MLPAVKSQIKLLLNEFDRPFMEDEVFDYAEKHHYYLSPLLVNWAHDNGYINDEQYANYHTSGTRITQYAIVLLCIVYNRDKIMEDIQ